MSNISKDVYVSEEVYRSSRPEDGLYECDITCDECGKNIGAWQEQRSEYHYFEMFKPYWMCDEDNNYNVCETCHTKENN